MSVLIPVFVLILVVMVTLPILLYGGTLLYRTVRLSRNEPADIQTVRMGGEGLVEFTGTAVALDGTVTGKYSEQECLAYEWEHEERDSGSTGDNRPSNYHTVGTGTDGEPFLVRDETTTVAVDPAGANIYAEDDEWKNRERIHRERRVEADDPLHVYGYKEDIVERQDGLGTESAYVGSNTHGRGRLEKIRGRPHMALGHILGFGSDLHITVGHESDAIKRFGVLGTLVTVWGLIQLVASALVIFVAL